MKDTTIEEAQDLRNIKFDELVGSLQIFEMDINESYKKKNKSISFISNTEENKDQCEKDTEESLLNSIAFIGRKFNKALKRLDR